MGLNTQTVNASENGDWLLAGKTPRFPAQTVVGEVPVPFFAPGKGTNTAATTFFSQVYALARGGASPLSLALLYSLS
jgi:hypothetical protein